MFDYDPVYTYAETSGPVAGLFVVAPSNMYIRRKDAAFVLYIPESSQRREEPFGNQYHFSGYKRFAMCSQRICVQKPQRVGAHYGVLCSVEKHSGEYRHFKELSNYHGWSYGVGMHFVCCVYYSEYVL